MFLRLCRMLEQFFVHLFADGLYKWFRQLQVRGPAATQASQITESLHGSTGAFAEESRLKSFNSVAVCPAVGKGVKKINK